MKFFYKNSNTAENSEKFVKILKISIFDSFLKMKFSINIRTRFLKLMLFKILTNKIFGIFNLFKFIVS